MKLSAEAIRQAVSKKLLTRIEAADFLNIKPQTLAVWTSTGRYQLPVVKVGRSVRYRMSDLVAFVESRTIGAAE